MSKKILINASHQEENRVAIVEDGILTELDIELEGREQTRGNIYKATVVRVETGLQAAFVDYGADRMGFLQIGEVHPDLYPTGAQDGNNRPRINDILKRGQELLVQITREERGSKGAALTTNISLAGRYMVLMPGSSTKGISRKVENEAQRKEIKAAMNSIDIPDNTGYIVRTAGIGQSIDELHRDFKYLYGIHTKILALANSSKPPKLIYQESNVVIRSIRDYFSPDMDEVLIDDPIVFGEAQDFFRSVMPEYLHLLKRHKEHRPIFSRYQIEEQIETITQNKVPLPSGGSIVIDLTEALVAIDVNSGKMSSEKGIEATAFKTNIEAAAEVGRQLRLRDLGGLVVVDFIDMRDRKNNRDVEKALKESLKNDKARVSVGRISQFGLIEMSRQRIRAALAEGAFLPCPHCNGSGRVKSTEAQAVAFLRQVHTTCGKGAFEKVEARVPTDVADYLLNAKREELFELEKSLKLTIEIKGQAEYISGQADLEVIKRVKKNQDTKSVDPITSTEDRPELSEEDKQPREIVAEKPKRKRRRKTAAEKKAEMEAAAADNVSEPVAVESADDSTDTVASATDESPAEEPQATDLEAKPKRRRRRRKTAAEKKAEMEAAAASNAEQPSNTPEPATVDDKAPETIIASTTEEKQPDDTAETKPKRRRRRKTVAEKRAEMNAAVQTSQADEPMAEMEAADPSKPHSEKEITPSATPQDQPKPRRRRKTAADKKAELEAEAAKSVQNNETVITPEPIVENKTRSDRSTETAQEPALAVTKPRQRRSSKPTTEQKTSTKAPAQAKKSQAKKNSGNNSLSEQPKPTKAKRQEKEQLDDTLAGQKPSRSRKTAVEKKAELDAATIAASATTVQPDRSSAPMDDKSGTDRKTTNNEIPRVDSPTVAKPRKRRKTAAEKKAELNAATTDTTEEPQSE
jgi:ribonuclease E